MSKYYCISKCEFLKNDGKNFYCSNYNKKLQKEELKLDMDYARPFACEKCLNGILKNKYTFLLNFNKNDFNLYDQSIKEFEKQTGKNVLYISKDAYWKNGFKDNSMYSLHCKINTDISVFWDILEQFKKYRRGDKQTYYEIQNKEVKEFDYDYDE